MPSRVDKLDIAVILRAVAITCSPDRCSSAARAEPMPPSEQPVMSTVLFDLDILADEVYYVRWETMMMMQSGNVK